MSHVRRAGVGRLPNGRSVTWRLAEKLELGREVGLLSLHPDGAWLHGAKGKVVIANCGGFRPTGNALPSRAVDSA
jgi:hypothetical protein